MASGKTRDDEAVRAVSLHQDEQGRIASVEVCTPPPAVMWMPADGIHIANVVGVGCKTISFHYATL